MLVTQNKLLESVGDIICGYMNNLTEWTARGESCEERAAR